MVLHQEATPYVQMTSGHLQSLSNSLIRQTVTECLLCIKQAPCLVLAMAGRLKENPAG